MARTRLSSKGQVIIPKGVRERHGWRAGLELEVEDHGDGVLLREASRFPRTTVEEVYGCLDYDGRPVTVEEMDEAVRREAMKHK
jgi:AbrB family looped-hinge helix DNA binding protein